MTCPLCYCGLGLWRIVVKRETLEMKKRKIKIYERKIREKENLRKIGKEGLKEFTVILETVNADDTSA